MRAYGPALTPSLTLALPLPLLSGEYFAILEAASYPLDAKDCNSRAISVRGSRDLSTGSSAREISPDVIALSYGNECGLRIQKCG